MRTGLGVEDMFTLVTALENLSEEEARLPIDQRMGLVRTSIDDLHSNVDPIMVALRLSYLQVMKHAGMAITITTVTDLVTFVIGNFTTKFSLVRLLCDK